MKTRVAAFLSISLFCVTSVAHEEFFFGTTREPPYEGPGYDGRLDTAAPLDFSSRGVRLLGWLPLGEFDEDAQIANDCWGYTAPSGREYALLGLSTGTGFVDLSTPESPRVVDFVEGPTSLWRDIKVFREYAYVVSEGGGGVQIFNLSEIDEDLVVFVGAVGAVGNDQTHNLAIDTVSAFLYRTAGDEGTTGLRIYDLSDPAAPSLISAWHERYVHDAQVVTYADGPYAGRQIAFCFTGINDDGGVAGIDILDVTDKANILRLSFYRYSDARFSHQGWLSPDRHYLYVGDERDERSLERPTTTRVLDVSDLERPTEVATFTNDNTATDHNIYTRDDLIFAANYRSGLRVFDATSPMAPVEVAHFDTYIEDDSAALNGLFSNYPFFASGIVIGSDIEKGLFVWWVGDPVIAFDYPDGRPTLLSREGESFRVRIVPSTASDLPPRTASLFFSTGPESFVEQELVALGEGEFEAVFPALPCEARSVSYFFSAESSNRIAWRDPSASTEAFVADVTLIDCNENASPDSCDIASESVPDCNENGIPDSCEIAAGSVQDCNENGQPDACDVTQDAHADCNGNGLLDSCEGPSVSTEDCNDNGVPDGCDLMSGRFNDCNRNAVPDACDLDSGEAEDRNKNELLDECEPPFAPFRRGDVNANLQFELADAVLIASFLFLGKSITCHAAADSDDNGAAEITDAIHLLNHLFNGMAAPAPPFSSCGFDRTPDTLECVSFDGCESG